MEHRRQHHRQNRIRFSRLALFSRRLLLSLSNASATYFMMHTFDGAIERGFCLGWLEKKNKGCRSNERSRRRAEKNEGKKNSAAKIKKLLTLSIFPKKKKKHSLRSVSLSLSLSTLRACKNKTHKKKTLSLFTHSRYPTRPPRPRTRRPPPRPTHPRPGPRRTRRRSRSRTCKTPRRSCLSCAFSS